MARGDVESWVRAKDAARAEAFSDGEDNNRWSPRRKPGETFSMEGGAGRRRSSTIMDQAAEALCCCGPRWGRKYNAVNEPTNPSDGLRTKGRWEVNEDDEYFKPPVWKQLILKVKAQARQANCSNGSNGNEWVNYDAESYEKNFDNGTWRDSSRDLVYHDQENEKLGLKERALHTALLHKLASSRSNKDGEQVLQVNSSPAAALSPLPVNHRSPPKPKDEFVPIWQRRASSPVTLDVRQRS